MRWDDMQTLAERARQPRPKEAVRELRVRASLWRKLSSSLSKQGGVSSGRVQLCVPCRHSYMLRCSLLSCQSPLLSLQRPMHLQACKQCKAGDSAHAVRHPASVS